MKLLAGGRMLTLVLTATMLRDDAGQPLGALLFCEDVTEIVKVQRMEAWREVARRIAHEIKNPLTPIQLSAQRLHKRYAEQLKGRRDALRGVHPHDRAAGRGAEDAGERVRDVRASPRRRAHARGSERARRGGDGALSRGPSRDRASASIADPSLPLLPLDREGIKRAVINMLDNAVAACDARERLGTRANGATPRIDVRTRYHRAHGIVALEVADTGIGIKPEERGRLFEPYFSTKQGGTGLGLAIVSTIVADHQGFVRVKDNEPHGSRFVVELPVKGPLEQIVLH